MFRLGPSTNEQSTSSAMSQTHTAATHAGSRNIVLCFDGTSNTFTPDLTNLPVIFSLLSADPAHQLAYYQSGVGTYAPEWTPTGLLSGFSQLADEAVAWNLPDHIQDGYRFLMQYYSPGDKIFLFGFSRGSHTARALAGMLQSSVSLAYHIYSKQQGKHLYPGGETIAQGFKRSYCRDVRVHFIGVFDTVASVGAIIPRTLPFAQGGTQIEVFRHALSLDERRARFYPQYWMQPTEDTATTTSSSFGKLKKITPTDVVEVFFAGVHSNVGGGFTNTDGDATPRLSHIPLRWMVREAFMHGLELDARAIRESPIYGRNPCFAQIVGNKIASKDPTLAEYCQPALNPTQAEEDVVGLVQFASRESSYLHEEALAPRGDALSFRIKTKVGGSTSEKISGFFERAGHRFKTAAWWILEVIPTLKIVWDEQGQRRKWTFWPNNGRGRLFPSTPLLFHESVRTRLEAQPADFPKDDGDNASIPENHYLFKARFPRGSSGLSGVTYVE